MTTEVYTALAELTREEEVLARKVDNLLSDAGTLSRSLQKLDLLRAQSQSLQVGSSYLLSNLEVSATTAERISFNVRGLDAEQSRVKETLKYVEEIKELKACVLGVHQSMEAQEWEVAAEYVHRASLVPDQIAKGQYAALMVPTAETPLSPAATIREASDQLYVLFTREFKQAAAARDLKQITRFFKLFPQIDKVNEGLDLYAEFVSTFIAERAEQALNTASTSPILYANLVTGLFENIAKLISNHTPLITRFYGRNIDRVLDRIQVECDKQGILILTAMSEDRQITKKVNEIKSYSFSFLVQAFLPAASSNSQAPEEREVDSKTLDALLSEISIIFSRWSLYRNFISHSARISPAPCLIDCAMATFLENNLESQYETMESYFMRRSVERAFQLEKQDVADAGHPVSSVVEDIFFILRKVTTRALSTCRLRTTSSIFAVVRRIMEQDYAGILGRRMQDCQARMTGPKTAIRSHDAEKRDRSAYCTLLNDLDGSAECMGKIMEEASKSAIVDIYENDKDAVLRVIEGLCTLQSRFSRGVEDGVNVLYNTHIKNRIRTILNETFASSSNYVLTHAQFTVLGQTRNLRGQFERDWRALITDVFEADLSVAAYTMLLKVTVRAFIRVLEKKLLTLKCNELGAIALDRDISHIINVCAGDYAGIRDRFDRVREMSHVVNFSAEEGDATSGEDIIKSLGLVRIGVEEVEMIRREMMVE